MRVVGVNIPDNKPIKTALIYIYGIGPSLAAKIIQATGLNPLKRAKDLLPEEVNKIQAVIEKEYKIEGEIRQSNRQNITRLKEIKAYRGIRHIKKLPVRGQRTRTNSRTVRGNVRRTAGSGRRKLELK